ncbi:MAG TPA: hypothetical protein VGC54_13065, partial [Planctomycetota bacterium]
PRVVDDGVTVFEEGRETPLLLAPVPDEPGTYRGRWRPESAGAKVLQLTEDGDPAAEVLASAQLEVTLPSAEMRQTSQDEAALAMLADRTGGMRVEIQQVGRLLERLDGRERATRTLASHDEPFDGSGMLVLFLLLASSEWLVRKWSNLS